jgi:hypothetical protein
VTADGLKPDDDKNSSSSIIGVGVALVTIGSMLMGYGGSEKHAVQALIWENSWFASGCASVVVGVTMVGVSAVTLILRRKRSRSPGPPPETVPHSALSEAPLRITILEEEWFPVNIYICTFALKIAMTNLTERPINLTQYSLQSNHGKTSAQRLSIAGDAWDAVMASIAQIKQNHAADLLTEDATVPMLNTISGWFVAWGFMHPPGSGRPACTFRTVDNLGNSYEFDITARLQRRYRSR